MSTAAVVLDQPTSDGDAEIHLLTNLTAREASAARVAERYRRRWTIEGRFLEMSQTMNGEPETLGYPPAARFAFSLALLASNAAALLRAASAPRTARKRRRRSPSTTWRRKFAGPSPA